MAHVVGVVGHQWPRPITNTLLLDIVDRNLLIEVADKILLIDMIGILLVEMLWNRLNLMKTCWLRR